MWIKYQINFSLESLLSAFYLDQCKMVWIHIYGEWVHYYNKGNV